jgi:aspartate/methionine/tyrosine aminotransferase
MCTCIYLYMYKKVIARCVPYPVFMADISIGPTVDELEAVYQELKAKSIKVKMLLLTNPNNPLGTIYSPSVIKNCISWARAKKVHTIVDEIYALSVHDVSFLCFLKIYALFIMYGMTFY